MMWGFWRKGRRAPELDQAIETRDSLFDDAREATQKAREAMEQVDRANQRQRYAEADKRLRRGGK